MTNDETKNPGAGDDSRRFDLEERTSKFGEAVIHFAKRIPINPVNQPLIGQLVRAGTSVGANYGEANDAESKKAFRQFINICRRESKETKHWLRMISAAEPALRSDAAGLWKEAKELNLIFGAIRRSTDEK